MGTMNFDQIEQLGMVALCCLIGFVIRLGKKFVSNGVNPIDYMKLHGQRTIAAFGAIIASATATYMTAPETLPMVYIMMAYMADSMINKTPTDIEVAAGRIL